MAADNIAAEEKTVSALRAYGALNRHGLHVGEQRFYAFGGISAERIIAILADEAGIQVDAPAVAREKGDAFLELLEHVGPLEPIFSIAQAFRGKLPMAVATGTSRRVIDRMHAALGITGWFAAIVTSDDVANPKPAPDTFADAARRLGVPPEKCRAYEDSDLGIQASRAAGIACVDVRELLAVTNGKDH